MSDELEARLRRALAERADEVGHPDPDEESLARRHDELARRRARRRGAALGAVAAGLLLGGLVVAVRPGDDGGQVRAGPRPRDEIRHGLCDGPATEPGRIALLGAPGARLVTAAHGAQPVEGVRGAWLYGPSSGALDRGVAVTVADRARASTAGSPVRLPAGTEALVEDRGGATRVHWSLPDGSTATLTATGLPADEVLALADEAAGALAAGDEAPLVEPGGWPRLAGGVPARVAEWATSWELDGARVDVATSTDADVGLTLAVADGWVRGEVGWAEVEGEPAVRVDAGEGASLLWPRADGWLVVVRTEGDVLPALCAVDQDRWPEVERQGATIGPRTTPPPTTAVAEPPG